MKRNIIKPLAGLLFLGLAGQANAGGIYLYEMGTEDVGLANAGSAARAQDASVVANNPAGMTRLQGNEFTFGRRPYTVMSTIPWTTPTSIMRGMLSAGSRKGAPFTATASPMT